jgi:hypothetical protein
MGGFVDARLLSCIAAEAGSSPASRHPQPLLSDDLPLDPARPTVDRGDHRVSNPVLEPAVESGPVLVAGPEARGTGQIDESSSAI